MDRRTFAVCAGMLLPLSAVSVGCGSSNNAGQVSLPSPPPTVFMELQAAAPGPWKLVQVPLEPALAMRDDANVPPSPRDAIASPSGDDATRPQIEVPLSGTPSGLEFSPGSEISSGEDPPVSDSSPAADITPIPDEAAAVGPPEHTELPWAHPAERTPEMIAVVERAQRRVQHGFRLAERGALYLARTEFVAALQFLTQANDAQQNTRLYGRALTAGLLALKESSDFVRPHSTRGTSDLAVIVARHKTRVLKGPSLGEMSTLMAAQRYYAYAQEQLSITASEEVAGSMALYGLGRVTMALVGTSQVTQLDYAAQAMVHYQAALMAEPNNFLAANELGVLLAENGQLEAARAMLVRSVTLSPRPATWRNLATVHARLGEGALAQRAQKEAAAMEQGRQVGPAVQWLDATAFAQSTPAGEGLAPAAASATPVVARSPAQPANEAGKPGANVAKKGISDWLPKSMRR